MVSGKHAVSPRTHRLTHCRCSPRETSGAPAATKWSEMNEAEFFETAAVRVAREHVQHMQCVGEAEEAASLLQTSSPALASGASATAPGLKILNGASFFDAVFTVAQRTDAVVRLARSRDHAPASAREPCSSVPHNPPSRPRSPATNTVIYAVYARWLGSTA